MQLESFTLRGGNGNLKKLMKDKIRPVSPGCCYLLSSATREDVYHCHGATVIVHDNYLTLLSEDMPNSLKGLERTINHSLMPFYIVTKHPHHHKSSGEAK